jgi:hypothetical protein
MNGILRVDINQLPPEVQTTINLISIGGLYPHSKDGILFKNLEGLLPPQPRGHYKEYTVPTPAVREVVVASLLDKIAKFTIRLITTITFKKSSRSHLVDLISK